LIREVDHITCTIHCITKKIMGVLEMTETKKSLKKKMLIVVTNHAQISVERHTGIWLAEFAEAYLEFSAQGYDVTVASPLGGSCPLDPGSVNARTPQAILDTRVYLEETLPVAEVNAQDYDGIFLPGGHGTMFDLPEHTPLQTLIRDFAEADKIVAAVCHGPAGLTEVTLASGVPLVKGRRLTSFTDQEETAAQLTEQMPFLLESTLRARGADFIAAPNYTEHIEVDGTLVTGQNPQSTLAVARAVIAQLEQSTLLHL
jgi:putative intracellular protease/amidase